MKEHIFNTIYALQENRKQEHRAPDTVTDMDIRTSIHAQVNLALIELVEEGRIIKGDAPNQDYYKIVAI